MFQGGNTPLEPVNGFEPAISNSLKRLHNRIKKEFPYVEFCVWDSRWFNEFMIHQLFRYQLVAEVEKDVLESVFSSITDFSKKAFLNPDATMYERYVSNFDEAHYSQAPGIRSSNFQTEWIPDSNPWRNY